jgi:hypothetical protein
MKLTEKLLRRPLPEQLKALLEKFDGDFDASHLRALKSLAFEESFTLYERFVLQRAHKMAQVRLERTHALDTAMTVVLNLKEEGDPHSAWYSNPAAQISGSSPYVSVTTTGLYQQQIDQHNRDRRTMGMTR